jgi:hypothetical protein
MKVPNIIFPKGDRCEDMFYEMTIAAMPIMKEPMRQRSIECRGEGGW